MEGRYASALYSAASKQNSLEAVEKDLIRFQADYKKDQKLRDFILDPTIKRSIKSSALKDASAQVKFNPATGFLLEVLADNGRLKKLDAVINAFKLIMSAKRGEVVCEVTTAKPLTDSQRKELEGQLKVYHMPQSVKLLSDDFLIFQKFVQSNETIQLTAKVDPAIIGGMVISIADRYVDMSVSSKIKKYTDLISLPV